MYKRGKLWVAATLFVLALGIQIGGVLQTRLLIR
ncbi:KxYKxGKxW signal peptide domain-containing protein [Lacticaseibacillus rhamnosus]